MNVAMNNSVPQERKRTQRRFSFWREIAQASQRLQDRAGFSRTPISIVFQMVQYSL